MVKKNFTNYIAKIFSKAINNKIYGSIEIYFEEGRVTQVTQRIINKIQHVKNGQKDISPKVPVQS